jgi:hypothetical protein
MSGETSIAATIFTGLLSTSPTAAITLGKMTNTYKNIALETFHFVGYIDGDLLK